nr:MAG TPA: hypothetical protein [Caudoviricetes sp.]
MGSRLRLRRFLQGLMGGRSFLLLGFMMLSLQN